MSTLKSRKILILYYHPYSLEEIRLGIKRHLKVLEHSEAGHDITYFNVYKLLQDVLVGCKYSSSITNDIREKDFNVVILHTTFLCLRWAEKLFVAALDRLKWLNEHEAMKIAFPQDEYDHSELLDQWLFTMNVDLIFSVLDERHWKTLYPIMHDKAIFYECYTGYIDDSKETTACDFIPYENRLFDIIYRASHLPFWFGSQGQLKFELADVFKKNSKKHKLRVNISTKEQDVVLGENWFSFLSTGRTVIGCESGSSVLDYQGEVRALIRALLTAEPDLNFYQLAEKMPPKWNSYGFTAISPRHLEAVETKTCQILVEGNYNGVFLPDKHYIPLKRDFSNIDEVLEKIKDHQYCQSIAERSYEDIFLSRKYSYKAFASIIDKAILNYYVKSDKVGSNMNKENSKVNVLERQLIFERHRNELLQAKLLEVKIKNETSKIKMINKLLNYFFKNKKLLILVIIGTFAFLGLHSFITAYFILRYLNLN